MTVRELIAKLKNYEGSLDERVSMSCDEEGNSYHDVGRIEAENDDNERPVCTIYPKHN